MTENLKTDTGQWKNKFTKTMKKGLPQTVLTKKGFDLIIFKQIKINSFKQRKTNLSKVIKKTFDGEKIQLKGFPC